MSLKPKAAATYAQRRCRYCGGHFTPARSTQEFCGTPHRMAWYRLAEDRGARLYGLVMRWRDSRGKDRTASLSDIARLADDWLAADKRAMAAGERLTSRAA